MTLPRLSFYQWIALTVLVMGIVLVGATGSHVFADSCVDGGYEWDNGNCVGGERPEDLYYTMTASPDSIVMGSSSTITWTGTAPHRFTFSSPTCYLTNDGTPGVYVVVPSNGSQVVSPTQTRTYSLVCGGNYFSISNPAAQATVTVTAPPPPPPPSAPCVINTTIGSIVPATLLVERGGNQDVQVDVWWGDGTDYVTSGFFTSGSCYPAYNPGCNGSYDTNRGGISYGNQHIYNTPGTYTIAANVRNGILESEVISLNGTWSGEGSSNVSCTVNVAGSNLTAGPITPTTAIAGTAVTLSSTITNSGSVSTGASFTNVFQSAVDASGTGATVIGTFTSSLLAAGASGSATLSYTFPSSGTKYVRACADNNASMVGTISETNEGDNCGPWTSLTVYPVPTASLTLSPASVAYGGATTVSWSSTGASSCSGTNFSTGNATSGSVSVSATQNTTYTVYCSGSGGTASSAKTLTVGAQPFPDLTSAIGPTVTTVAGQSTSFTGTTNNIGNAATATAFNDLFIYYAANQSDWITYARVRTGTLGAGASVARTTPYAFATPGTYYYRLCADWDGEVTESNEGNNCSNFGTVVVRPSPPTGLAASCNANGTQVTLSWNTPAGGADNYYVRMTGTSSDGYVGNSITYPVTPGQYYDWWVHSNIGPANYDSNHYSDAAYSGVTCAGLADLTAGSVTPSSGTVGTPVALTANTTNNGTAISGSFPTLFQVSQNGALIASGYQSGLAVGATGASSGSYTFNAPGTYQVRACSNYNTSWTAITPESNYGNNCGAWTNITIVPPNVTCSVSNQNPFVGQTVAYTAAGGGSYVWTASDGATGFGSGATANRTFVSPGTYGMQASSFGATGFCPLVTVGCPGSPTVSISANPTRIRKNGSTTVSWSASGINAATCTVTGTDGYAATVPTNACNLGPSSVSRTLATQTKFTITCGGVSQSVTVNVVPSVVEF